MAFKNSGSVAPVPAFDFDDSVSDPESTADVWAFDPSESMTAQELDVRGKEIRQQRGEPEPRQKSQLLGFLRRGFNEMLGLN